MNFQAPHVELVLARFPLTTDFLEVSRLGNVGFTARLMALNEINGVAVQASETEDAWCAELANVYDAWKKLMFRFPRPKAGG